MQKITFVIRHSLMLALVLACSISAGGVRAQTFTQVSYNFLSAPDIVADGLNSYSTTLTMNSLAANGTGQWTSFNPGGTGNWALLGNHLLNAASDGSFHGGIVQTGTLANSMPTNRDEIKVTANLQGAVRYVCPDPSRHYFIIQGFDEGILDPAHAQIIFPENGINLTVPSSTLPVKSPMYSFNATVSTYWSGDNEFQSVIPSTAENPRDEFDVASDNTYIYITWETYTDGVFKVFAIAIKLLDGSVALCPVFLGNGIRPTIAADVRNSPSAPSFDAAWISGAALNGIYYRTCLNGSLSSPYTLTPLMQMPNGTPDVNYTYAYHARIVVGSAFGAVPSPNGPRAIYAIVDPTSNPGTGHLVLFKDVQRYALGSSWTPEHAWYVDGSFLNSPHPVPLDGTFPVDNDPIIAFSNPYDGQGEIPPSTPSTTPFNEYHCLYRLHRIYVGGTHDPLMIVRGSDHFCSTNAMNVCLNTSAYNGNPHTINRPDIAHVFWEDPAPDANGVVSYIGAVNQMGIHCHWRSSTNNHYYMRDSRAFDEPIEELTLETYTTVVRNGSDHAWIGGTNNPVSIKNPPWIGGCLALWCEGSTSEFAASPGSTHAPVLSFQGTGTELLANGGWGCDIVAFPPFLVQFSDPTQSINVNPGGIFDYYGNSGPGSLEHFAFSGSGSARPSLNFLGSGATMSAPENGYPTSIPSSTASYLNIHGGCGFTTTTSINFIANQSKINCLEETPYSGSSIADGFDYCMGSQAFTSCIISGGNPTDESAQPQIIQGVPCTLSDNAFQFSMTNCLVQNISTSNPPGSVEGIFQNNPNTPSTNYRGISITGGEFNGCWWEFDDPMDPVTVANSTFVNIDGDYNYNAGDSYQDDANLPYFTALTFGRPSARYLGDFLSYSQITVSGCTFTNWTAWPIDNQNETPYWPCVGIYMQDFDYVHSNEPSLISIEGNTFTNDGSELAGSIHAGIFLNNCCGSITGNTITGAASDGTVTTSKYMIGIEHDNLSAFTTSGSGIPSFICSNTIKNLMATGPADFCFDGNGVPNGSLQAQQYGSFANDADGTFMGACGLFIDNMSGDEQLNIINDCYVGRFGGFTDYSHLVRNNIQNCTSFGMETYGTPWMSGYHYNQYTPDSRDIGGWNVIKNNDATANWFWKQTQILVYNIGNEGNCLSGPTVIFGSIGTEIPGYTWTWTVFGDNDVEAGTNGSDIEGKFPALQFYDPSGNYWGGADMKSSSLCDGPSTYLTSLGTAPSFQRTGGGYGTKHNEETPLSTPLIDTAFDTSDCRGLLLGGQELGEPPISEYYQGADTLEYYVEHCYNYSGFYYLVFGTILSDMEGSGPNGNYPGNGDTLTNLLQWYFNVLYLNTDTQYYCDDASAAVACLGAEFIHDSSIHANPLNGASGQAAVETYLLESGKCSYLQSQLKGDLNQLYQNWHRAWKDTVTDSLLTPWDTTNLPTLQQIGFEALLGSPAAVQGGIIPTSVLGNVGVAPNPFTDNTVIDYTLNVPATLTVEVFNVLGQKVASPMPSVFTINGNYSLTLTGSALASGAYYVRFAVPEGEVRTIMITKE